MTISEKIRADLLSAMNIERLFQKHVVDGPSFLFREHLSQPDDEYHLRHEIATACECSMHDVIIIGSAKLGFSVKTRDFREFDHLYSESKKTRDKSDVDIAIVNRKYFDTLTQEVFVTSNFFDEGWIKENWQYNHYHTNPNAELFENYVKYLAKGWARPDYLPDLCVDESKWKSVCKKWKGRLDRKVSVGIYSNWFYLTSYHTRHLATLRAKLNTLEIK